jgi:hypothetical protein
MSGWVAHSVSEVLQSVLIALALWSWASFCAIAAAKICSRSGVLDADWRDFRLASGSSILLVGASTLDLILKPRAELFGIHGLAVSPPYTWWVWGGMLVLEPVVTALKIKVYWSMLLQEMRGAGAPLRVKPLWTELLHKVFGAIYSWSNYVG